MEKRKYVSAYNADWRYKKSDNRDFQSMLRASGTSIKACSKTLFGNEWAFRQRLGGSGYLTDEELQVIAKMASMTASGVAEFFEPLTKLAKSYLLPKEALPTPPKTVVKRTSIGYQIDFEVNGERHQAYGATELDARKAAEKRKKEIMGKNVADKDGRLSIVISNDEAMVLLNQLMNDFRDKSIADADKKVLQSIYLRLSTQII